VRWPSERAALALATLVAGTAMEPATARAAAGVPAAVDPSYGRIDGDIALVVAAGLAVASPGPRAEAELRLRYLQTAGVFAALEDGGLLGSGAEPWRTLSTGVELRPLFLFRWLKGRETEHARLDLAIDSIALELGATFDQPRDGVFASRRGFQAGLGIELPVFESASGPWVGLRGLLRWSDEALGQGAVSGRPGPQAVLAVTIAWHQLVAAHVVDVGDEAPE